MARKRYNVSLDPVVVKKVIKGLPPRGFSNKINQLLEGELEEQKKDVKKGKA